MGAETAKPGFPVLSGGMLVESLDRLPFLPVVAALEQPRLVHACPQLVAEPLDGPDLVELAPETLGVGRSVGKLVPGTIGTSAMDRRPVPTAAGGQKGVAVRVGAEGGHLPTGERWLLEFPAITRTLGEERSFDRADCDPDHFQPLPSTSDRS